MLHFVIIISSFCIKLNYEIFVFCFTNIKGSDKLQFVCLIGGTRPNLGATRPRVGIANLGFDAPSWQYLKY